MTGTAASPGQYLTGTVLAHRVAAVLERAGCAMRLVRHGPDVPEPLATWARAVRLPDWQARWPATGRTSWVVVAGKSTCGVMRTLGDLETTGVDWGEFKRLEEVERITGQPVVIAFAHRKQNAVVLADLHHHRVAAQGAGAHLAFWDFSKLSRLCSYDILLATLPRDQRLQAPLFAPPELPARQLGLFDGAKR